MLNLIVVGKKPVVNKGLFHLVHKEGSNNALEISMIFEVNEQIHLMRTEIRVFLVLLLIGKRMPFDQEFKISITLCLSKQSCYLILYLLYFIN